jgi:hypothetical protein
MNMKYLRSFAAALLTLASIVSLTGCADVVVGRWG